MEMTFLPTLLATNFFTSLAPSFVIVLQPTIHVFNSLVTMKTKLETMEMKVKIPSFPVQ